MIQRAGRDKSSCRLDFFLRFYYVTLPSALVKPPVLVIAPEYVVRFSVIYQILAEDPGRKTGVLSQDLIDSVNSTY
jgi:hypothetical protein